ncbi:hypothetical protein V5F29_10535 [Xanthobacter aminoxidans]|uniref:hypothetical protein n=1 Tax=Xanthobacter aminoxidans TaxID=186280 RepID=UPI003728672D
MAIRRPLARSALLPALLSPLFAAAPALADGTEAKTALKADGSTSLTYSTPVLDYGAVVGLDLSATRSSVAPTVGQSADGLGGTAYAKITVSRLPDWMVWEKGTLNVSVDPNDAASKLATTFERTVPLTSGLVATLADTYQVKAGSQAWETDKSLSLKLTDMGTTFAVSTKATSNSPELLPAVSAQQQLAPDLTVTTSLADTGSTLNKSITAGFTHRW